MSKKLVFPLVAGIALVAMLVSVTVTTAVAQDEERKETLIRIKKTGGGDDAVIEKHHKVIFVGEDGDATEIDRIHIHVGVTDVGVDGHHRPVAIEVEGLWSDTDFVVTG